MIARVLITGSSGFLGSHVMKRFSDAGCEIFALDNQTKFATLEKWQQYALTILKQFNPDLILNIGGSQLGGDGVKEINELTNSNVIAPALFASFLKENNPKGQLITISTSWQYGVDGKYSPFNLYAASKQALDDYLLHFGLGGLKITSLVLFDTYSEKDERRKIHNLIKWSLEKNESLEMTAGEQRINFTHVDDVAEAVYMAYMIRAEDKGQFIGLVKWAVKSKNTIKVKQLLSYVQDASKLARIKLGARPYREREVFEICENLPLVPGWEPKVDFNEAICRIIK